MLIHGRHLLACLVLVPIIETAKILAVFPTPSLSHQFVFRPYIHELVKRGHHVTVITSDPAFPDGNSPVNLTEINVHNISYAMKKEYYEAKAGQNADLYDQIDIIWTLLANIFYEQLKIDEVAKLIKEQTFDLLILEPVVRSTIALRHVYNVPVIQISSFGATEEVYNIYGAATHPLVFSTCFRKRIYNLSVFEKLKEVYEHYRYENLIKSKEAIENRLMKEYFGPDIPTMSELNNLVDLLFLNIHPIWDENRPVPPSVVYLGGLHIPAEKDLPEDLKNYLDSSKHGVIYMSFGTNVQPSLLSEEKIQMINKVFSQLPYDILWKFDKDELLGKASNVKFVKWIPQSDVLRHPKVKLFITQGGLQSTDESINAGVPLLGIPMIADQWYNVEKYERHGIGLKMEFKTMTEKQFLDGIKEVIQNEKYRRNVLKLKKIVNDCPQTSLERAIWWTEHILRHGGGRHLRAPSANMSWMDYLELRLVAICLSVLLFILALVCYVFYLICFHFIKFKSNIKLKSN